MRGSFSIHNESIHAQASGVWPRYRNEGFRPNLNIPLLTKILSASAIHQIPSAKSMSKRKASGPSQAFRKTKRVKTSEDSRDNNVGEDELDSSVESEPELCDPALSYPHVRVFNNSGRPEADSVPVLRHVLEIHYSPRTASPMLAQKWNAQDEELSKTLFALSESLSSPQTVELGEVQFAQHEGRIIGVPADSRYGTIDGPPWLLLVPPLTIDEESNDFRSPQAADILSAIQILQAHRRANVTANLRIRVYPQDDELLSVGAQLFARAGIHSLYHSSCIFRARRAQEGHAQEGFRRSRRFTETYSPSGIPSRRHHFDGRKRPYHGFHLLLHHGLGSSSSLAASRRCIATRRSITHASSLSTEERSLVAGEGRHVCHSGGDNRSSRKLKFVLVLGGSHGGKPSLVFEPLEWRALGRRAGVAHDSGWNVGRGTWAGQDCRDHCLDSSKPGTSGVEAIFITVGPYLEARCQGS